MSVVLVWCAVPARLLPVPAHLGFLVAAPGRAVSGVSGTIIVPSRCHGGSACSVWADETYGHPLRTLAAGLPAVLWCRPVRVVPWLRGPPSFYGDVPNYAGCVSPSTFRVIVAIDYGQHDLGCKSRNFQRRFVGAWLMRSASSISLHSSLEEEPVTHFVALPNLQEDEGMLRETLENLCRSPFGR